MHTVVSSGTVHRCAHRWAIATQYIEQFRIALSIVKMSAPTIQRNFPSMGVSLLQVWDVVVVGAGVAGSAVAHRQGLVRP